MALSSLSPPLTHIASTKLHLSFPCIVNPHPHSHSHNYTNISPLNKKWQTNVSFFPSFFNKKTKDPIPIKQELLQAIEPLDRGADATPQDQQIIDQIACRLEACNPTKEPLNSTLLNGKWELIYTTSKSILQIQRPKILRSRLNYQAINVDTLRAQNMEGWPFFNQVFDLESIFFLTYPTMLLVAFNAIFPHTLRITFSFSCVTVNFDCTVPNLCHHILIFYPIFDRVSRGDLGNLFILKMVDPSYKVPT
ncbi:probable plastid-lipid-associated protein 4, chloroplastic [Solanum pennellii]|uniref:Probable plastid-lipid-associated protein 4, chloroplastic n=1 Tax=Solanum pennellii TaxID=28526 RepID=A0ABM1FJ41_SOLPN|nr:probable plastid-lipid-associated protein 4, chloroplastic [Solanum pennellii]